MVGLHAVGAGRAGWEQILRQEGLPFLEAEEPVSTCGVFSDHLPEWFEPWVAAGAVAIVIGADEAMGLFPPSEAALIHRFRPPDDDRAIYGPDVAALFRGVGHGECRLHEDRKVKGGHDPDVFPLVLEQPLGQGTVIFTGVHLTRLLTAAGDCLRRFSPFTEVDERVASVDKAGVADTLVWMLRRAFRFWGPPYVRPVRFPHGAPSAFIFRVDVDGLFGGRTRRLADVARAHGVPVSFYFNGELCDQIPGELNGWADGHELAQHGYQHNVFETVEENLQNLKRGADWFRAQWSREPRGFVAPRGLWNSSLEAALIQMGYTCSSDFSLAFDGLPFRTPGGILQVPVHPYSPERAWVFAEEQGRARPPAAAMAAYYGAVLADQVRRHRPVHFYGHPEVLGAMAEAILAPLFSTVEKRGLPALTLGGLAAWWERRETSRFEAEFDSGARHLSVRVSGPPIPLEVLDGVGWLIDDGAGHSQALGQARQLVGVT